MQAEGQRQEKPKARTAAAAERERQQSAFGRPLAAPRPARRRLPGSAIGRQPATGHGSPRRVQSGRRQSATRVGGSAARLRRSGVAWRGAAGECSPGPARVFHGGTGSGGIAVGARRGGGSARRLSGQLVRKGKVLEKSRAFDAEVERFRRRAGVPAENRAAALSPLWREAWGKPLSLPVTLGPAGMCPARLGPALTHGCPATRVRCPAHGGAGQQ